MTAGYIIIDVERLRAPMQKITDHLSKLMGVKKSAEIVKITEHMRNMNVVENLNQNQELI